MIENYICNTLKSDHTVKAIELDIYLQSKQLAFEYQGEQHYFDVYALGSKWYQTQRDQEKKTMCNENGITLIEVPYWWDFDKLSLISTIHDHRPDLFPIKPTLESIPNQPQENIPTSNNISFFVLFCFVLF